MAIYPSSARSLLALEGSIGTKAAGGPAVLTLRKVWNRGYNLYRRRSNLPRWASRLDGHSMLQSYPLSSLDQVAGRYKSKDSRYIVRREGNHLHVIEIDPMGDLNDDYLAFADSKGGFYVPFDGTLLAFKTSHGKRGQSNRADGGEECADRRGV